jgi:hypothetical protein
MCGGSTACYCHIYTSIAVEHCSLEATQLDLGAGWEEALVQSRAEVRCSRCTSLICSQLEPRCRFGFGVVFEHTFAIVLHYAEV